MASPQTKARSNGAAPAPEPKREDSKRRPIEVIRRYVGGATVDIAIFDRKIEKRTASGVFTRYTYFVTVSKSWKKKREEGQEGPDVYESSSVFNPHELLVLADAIKRAYDRCNELLDAQGQDPDGEEGTPF